MRNALYPFSKARYIRPGSDTFLTKQKLAVPLIPGNEVPSRNESDPFRMEFKQLLENVLFPWRWLIVDSEKVDST